MNRGKSYGDLKRVSRKQAAVNRTLKVDTVAVLAFPATEMPPGAKLFVFWFGAVSVFLGFAVVGASLAATRILDVRQAR